VPDVPRAIGRKLGGRRGRRPTRALGEAVSPGDHLLVASAEASDASPAFRTPITVAGDARRSPEEVPDVPRETFRKFVGKCHAQLLRNEIFH
jgi:hypothetical protein